MRGIVIAAGAGARMGALTAERPKCMLPVGGRPILHHTMERLREAGCDEIVVVVGYCAVAVDSGDAIQVSNPEFRSNNILHSLLKARDYLRGPLICSYSDIWVEPTVLARLMATDGDIVLGVDKDWRPYYEGRTEHPITEAENVHYDDSGRVRRIGKHLAADAPEGLNSGEFLGLWRMNETGTRTFIARFEAVDRMCSPDDPFQNAAHWRQAYITDLLQELTDQEAAVQCAIVERGWAELDTQQDYRRLPEIAERQRLDGVARAGVA